jgi:predicted HTH transcriptional regulator
MGEAIAKTISCFMNSKGGILLIGVDDEGNELCLENDLGQLEKGNFDEFELHLTNVINTYLGKVSRAFVNMKFERVNDKEVAAVLVRKSPRPVFVKHKGKKEFYIRSGNSCQPLDIQDANLYIQDHWPDLRG